MGMRIVSNNLNMNNDHKPFADAASTRLPGFPIWRAVYMCEGAPSRRE
jgi:hypothetical protein